MNKKKLKKHNSDEQIETIRKIQDELIVIVKRLRSLGAELPGEPHSSGYALMSIIRGINKRIKSDNTGRHSQAWDGDTLDSIIWWLEREK